MKETINIKADDIENVFIFEGSSSLQAIIHFKDGVAKLVKATPQFLSVVSGKDITLIEATRY